MEKMENYSAELYAVKMYRLFRVTVVPRETIKILAKGHRNRIRPPQFPIIIASCSFSSFSSSSAPSKTVEIDPFAEVVIGNEEE